MIKKIVLAVMFIFMAYIPQSYAGDVKILVNGQEIQSEVPPIINNGTTLVPIRVVSESLGAKVIWEPETSSIFISGQTAIALRINNKCVSVDGKQTELIQAPVISAGKTMVPIRFIAEAFGCNVGWENGKVLIQKGETPGSSPQQTQQGVITDTVIVDW